MPKGIKKTINILVNFVAALMIVAATIPIVLQFSRIQNFFSDIIEKEISQKIASKVTIGDIHYQLFNTIRIKDLYVEDQQKDTLLYIKKTYLDVQLWNLLKGKVLITALEFNNLRGNVKQFKNGKTNIDFIINAFKKPDDKKPSNLEYKIRNLSIRNSAFNYKIESNLQKPLKAKFDPNHLQFTDLNADIELNILKSDTLSVNIKNINLKEISGFELKKLSTQLIGSTKGAKIQFIELELPSSSFNLSDIEIKYDSLSNFKKFTEKVKFKIPLNRSSINLTDFTAFVPEFENLTEFVDISGTMSGSISNLKVKNLELKHGKSLYLNTDIEINGLPSIQDAFIYTDIKDFSVNKSEIQDFVSRITKKPLILPKELNNLGLMRYNGNVTGFLSNLVTYGNLKTNIGSISTDILLKFENKLKDLTYSGSLKTNNLQINKLLNSDKIGALSMNISTDGKKQEGKPLKGKVKGTIESFQMLNYTYNDILLDGKYDGSGFDGAVKVNDQNIDADFKGIIDLTKKLPVFDFTLNVKDADLNALNFTEKYAGSLLAFDGKTNMMGKTADDINGYVAFNNIVFTNKNKTLNIEAIKFISRISNNHTNFSINSDFLNGSFYGQFSYSKVPDIVNNILKSYLPSLSKNSPNKISFDDNIAVDLQLSNTKAITEVLELPFEISGTSTLKGSIYNNTNKINFEGSVPKFKYNNQVFEKVTLNVENVGKQIKLLSRGQMFQKNGITSIFATASASNDSVSSLLGWHSDSKMVTNAGEVSTVARLRNEDGKIAANIEFKPSQIIISDSIWTIKPSSIDLNADSTIKINKFKFENNSQFIFADGVISKKEGNNIQFAMNDLNLNFIFQLLKLKSINIGGNVTGNASLVTKDSQPVFLANLRVQNATLNQKSIGNAHIKSTWDNSKSQMILNADFVKNNKDSIGIATGIFEPKSDSLDVVFDLKGLPIDFLQRYFEGVVSNVNGYGYGKLRMFGPTKTIGFEGEALIEKAQVTVNTLKTTYFFNDTIRLTKKSIELKNIEFFDAERNRGTVNGIVHHNGLFQKMNYNINIKGKNIIGLDTQAKDNDYFYGKAYTTGTVNITGNDDECSIVVKAVTQPKSKAFIQMGGASTASDNSFIRFESPENFMVTPKPTIDKNRFNTKVDLNIDVTNDADMQLIVDPKAGDVIAGRGNGSLRVQFDTFSDIKLYGTYTINSGYYLFTLQTIVRKEFKIDDGSTLSWTGDPFGAKVNIRAIYPLTASLSNILDAAELSSSTRRTSMPVNCILKLTDDLMTPTIKFEIDLPTADESMKQKLRSVINTDEMMNRQIAYLLAVNSFFNPEQVTNANQGAISSFVSSTLSAHLNNFIQKTLKSDMLSLGFDVQQTDATDTQYKAQVMLQPNDRIIVNSNVGYRADKYTQNPEDRYMWDVDFEYLLTDNGKLRFKAYSHTIDRAQLKEAKTTQGMGFVYKEDFQSVNEMLRYYWRIFNEKIKNQTKLVYKK
ncbi:MAG: translocation/assembly module TamB domain-containing protein [Paludibacter sp.]